MSRLMSVAIQIVRYGNCEIYTRHRTRKRLAVVRVSVHAGATAAPAAHRRESIYAFPTIALPLPWAQPFRKKKPGKSGL